MLNGDDPSFSRTQLYLAQLVNQALETAKVPEGERSDTRSRILTQVPVAAQRFLTNYSPDRTYTFATYFTWYIQQEIG